MNASPNPAQFKRGAQVGAPPSLEQIPVDRLQVDAAYQRATDSAGSRKIINGMVKRWDWSLCQPLVVARRSDGALYILDGQHRHAGATERGDIPFLPCVVLSSLGHADEARTFVELNTRRQKLTQAQVFHGMLAAGDDNARLVLQLIEETGWRVRTHSNTAAYGAGDLECAPMLVKVVAAKGGDPVRFALTVLRLAYPDTAVRQTSTMLKALLEIFDNPDHGLTATGLASLIGSVPPGKWASRAAVLQEQRPNWSRVTALAKAIMAEATGEEAVTPPRSAPAPMPPAPTPSTGDPAIAVRSRPQTALAPAQRPRAASAPSPFGTTGKGWCEQCQSLRSREHAAACSSRFCKLRPHT
jgi:hypothetical protein